MQDRLPVRVTGPLGRYVAGYRAELVASGYHRKGVARQLRLMADASGWLASEGLGAVALLSAVEVERFLKVRRAAGAQSFVSRRSFVFHSPLLGYLQRRGALGLGEELVLSPVDALLARYRAYLLSERGLVPGTVAGYVALARVFLEGRLDRGGELDLAGLTAREVLAFVLSECERRPRRSAQLMATVLRSMLRFLHVKGLIGAPLAQVVPAQRNWRLAGLPRALEPEQVARLLSACDRRTAVGRRNYAVVLMLARLGMRRCEVAALSLDDIDWRAGELAVCGKGRRIERVPLPTDVGQALAEYLQRGRPESAQGRAVFVRVKPPHCALTPHGVTEVVVSAGRQADLGYVTAHRLRHSAARELLRAGAGLTEIEQLLRHRSTLTTAIYAKCAARRSVVSPAQPGGTRRKVLGSNGLPRSER